MNRTYMSLNNPDEYHTTHELYIHELQHPHKIHNDSEQGWSSYLGVSVAGMPNFCMTMGSNTAVGASYYDHIHMWGGIVVYIKTWVWRCI